ncbi:bifunctional glycosyltransferase/CDP-glycerol:glycerophosphate glycerophosphotransferase [Virgibacillus dakarensis]|uniref:bifunctional glycosyltransferase/CDP-glycerol:glycerophosphate glycerophosphotransferase n=1 Tax=Virgibacillus dakarensis TaxID=1917889 RepID=UPI000B446003|nr:CDP-glycerol:glycerophosphate glycerophosphotransferase [Virgibacillus dakarensis]
MEKVSVIIPVYNTEDYIKDCLNSVMEQTYTNIEILLVNDNSNKECTLLLERISKQDSRIQLFHFQKRGGVGAARNFGIEKANGDFIYFLDSDDYLPNKTLEILVKNIKNNNMIHGKIKSTYFNSGMAIILEGLYKIKTYSDEKYNLIKNNLVNNFLFKKEFILDNKLFFFEDVEVYTDLTFMVPALINTEQVPHIKEAVYFKRKRNDPITNPSLSQMDEYIKIKDFLYIYSTLKNIYNDELANNFLDEHLLNFYRKDIVTYFKQSENIDPLFSQLVKTLKKVDTKILGDQDFILKREAKKIIKGDIDKYKKINSRHQWLRELKGGLKGRRRFYRFLYNRLFIKLPIKQEWVFFESFLGKSYSDNSKYIYEYMINNNMKFKYIWSLNEKKDIPGTPIQVKRFSLRYFYYLARSGYWVSNSRLPKYLTKREGNIYLQTWHGTPLKTLVFDIKDIYSADPNYKKNFFVQSRRWDYLNSPNLYSSEIFRRAFKYDGRMLEFGYPRNDILYKKNTKEYILGLKKQMNIPANKKVILYAPTWRDDEFYGRGKYKFNLQLDLEKLQNEFEDEYIILLRMHYFIASQMDISEFEGFVYDFSDYDDIAELYLVSDILITDYSSVFFDYANLQRPILFYTYDLKKYRDKLRGFYIDLEKEAPGPLLMNTDEVLDAVKHIEDTKKKYEYKYRAFYERFCEWDDGNATENTVKSVFGKE